MLYEFFSKKSFLSPSNDAFGPFNSLEAFTRSSLIEEIKRANTDSVMIVNGIPNSNALIEVHFPVPFDLQYQEFFQLMLLYFHLTS